MTGDYNTWRYQDIITDRYAPGAIQDRPMAYEAIAAKPHLSCPVRPVHAAAMQRYVRLNYRPRPKTQPVKANYLDVGPY